MNKIIFSLIVLCLSMSGFARDFIEPSGSYKYLDGIEFNMDNTVALFEEQQKLLKEIDSLKKKMSNINKELTNIKTEQSKIKAKQEVSVNQTIKTENQESLDLLVKNLDSDTEEKIERY